LQLDLDAIIAAANLLDKPLNNGGLAFSRFYASAILAAAIIACVALLPQRAGTHPGNPSTTRVY
jgi:uncharacterized membrane-anchored protein